MRSSYFSKYLTIISKQCPYVFLFLMIVGSILSCGIFSLNIIIVFIGISILFFGNGLIYSACVKHIDDKIESKYRLTCLSFWLVFSDIGAIIGSNIWPSLVSIICKHLNESYYCANAN